MTVAVTYLRPGNDHIIVVFQWHTYSVLQEFFLIPRKLIIKIRTLSLSRARARGAYVRHLEWRHVGVQSQRSRSLQMIRGDTSQRTLLFLIYQNYTTRYEWLLLFIEANSSVW